MARTLRDLFTKSEFDTSVKQETETFLEEETTGIRIKSLVDINNPLIYGNEATRIALRTTPTLDSMKSATGGELSSGGLIDKGLNKLTGGKVVSLSGIRDTVNTTLGIPVPLIPTRVAAKMEEGLTAQQVLDLKNGTELGKILKESGGKPKTIITQGIGGGLNFAKDVLRDTLFGKKIALGEADGNLNGFNGHIYNSENTYEDEARNMGITDPIETKEDFNAFTHVRHNHVKQIDLSDFSPIYGVDRKSNLWNSKLGTSIRDKQSPDAAAGEELSKYSPVDKYTGEFGDIEKHDSKAIDSLTYGIGYKDPETGEFSDSLNLTDAIIPNADTEKYEGMDLVPFWIGFVGSSGKTHFRTLLTGISETVTPSWNESNFFGNPFSFRTYSTIARLVVFSLQIYCMSKAELDKNWARVEQLTQYSYPRFETVNGTEIVKPPIIEFRIGDVYVNKVGIIDSLSYTFPDNGTWELEKGSIKPKFIDISLSITFIEQPDVLTNGLYGVRKKPESTYSGDSKTQPA